MRPMNAPSRENARAPSRSETLSEADERPAGAEKGPSLVHDLVVPEIRVGEPSQVGRGSQRRRSLLTDVVAGEDEPAEPGQAGRGRQRRRSLRTDVVAV